MVRKVFASLVLGLMTALWAFAGAPDKEMDKFIDSLMTKMTLEEKVGQLTLVTWDRSLVTGTEQSKGVTEKISRGAVGGVFNVGSLKERRAIQEYAMKTSRLGIPLMFGLDVIHGFRTTLPIPLALSCSWDMDLIERTAASAADEASSEGLDWVYSPMVDLVRDPRWGRVAESSGEDPYLGALVAAAMVRGHQKGDLSRRDAVMSCVKHFALYGAGEGGRDYDIVDMSPSRMYQEYLPPYKAAVDAGAGSVMSSFNEINGVPATANRWLLTDLLRGEWGFDGFVVSDYTSVGEMVAHGIGSLAEVSAKALKAGLDMDMVTEGVSRKLDYCLENGLISEADIDVACRRILEAKYKLGLFDDPYLRLSGTETPRGTYDSLALEAACKSMVLLKNEDGILPLDPGKKVLLVGPLANTKFDLKGTWAGPGITDEVVTIKQGLERYVPGVKHVMGCIITRNPDLAKMIEYRPSRYPDNASLVKEAVEAAAEADVVVAVLGETSKMSGESASMTDISLQEPQKELLEALYATGKDVVLVLVSERPMTLMEENEGCKAILEAWAPGAQGGNAVADILFGKFNPSGRLSMTFPRNVGQIPVYYSMKPTGRPYKPFTKYKNGYIDCVNEPLYPFGYGLSYTDFEYSSMEVKVEGDGCTVSFDVTNTGSRTGVETAQVYVRDVAASVTRPMKELKGFCQVELGSGQTQRVSVSLGREAFEFYSAEKGGFVAEDGEFVISVGPNSAELPLSAKLKMEFGDVCGDFIASETVGADGNRYAVVNLSVNFLRSEPDYTSALETQILMGSVVEIVGESGYWKQVATDEPYVAWCTDLGLAEMDAGQIEAYRAAAKYICTAWKSTIYSAPSRSAAKICDLVEGDILRQGFKGQDGVVAADASEDRSGKPLVTKGFSAVILPDGTQGYVPKNDLQDLSRWEETRVANAENILAEAMKYVGVPYMWGGASPNAVDCSGFVRRVYMMNGIHLPRNASQQIHKGTVVSIPVDASFHKGDPRLQEEMSRRTAPLRPGDLLFFGYPGKDGAADRITHVGLYIGGGRMIHSSHIVRINSLLPDGPDYYENSHRLLHARRYISEE